MIIVLIGRTHEAIIDDIDFDLISKRRWSLLERRYKEKTWRYATTWINGTNLFMHRILLGAKHKERVDHINGDGLDNRRDNIRICSHLQNMQNRRISCNNTSGYKGVHKEDGRWVARIKVNGKNLRLGRFDNAIDAGRAYNKAAVLHYGQFACLNLEV